MPFSAINEKGIQFNIVDYTRRELNKIAAMEFGCIDKDCGGVMRLKAIASQSVSPHFAHKRGTGSKTCKTISGGVETKEHKAGKKAVMKMYNKAVGATVVELEVIDSDIRADVGVYMIDGKKVCHEIELAKPYPSSIEDRTKQRTDLGWDVVWWFDVDSTRALSGIAWASEVMDWYGELKFRKDGDNVIADAKIIDAAAIRRANDRAWEDRQKRKDWAADKRQSLVDAYNALDSNNISYPNPFQDSPSSIRKHRIDFKEAELYINSRLASKIAASNYATKQDLIGSDLPTQYGVATIAAYNEQTDTYTSDSGCDWKIVDGVLHPVYAPGFLEQEQENRRVFEENKRLATK